MSKNFYITSPIYYVNDVPHIGHAYTSIACDVLARFKRIDGYDVHFLTGTDEHGQKVEKSASAKGVEPQKFCDDVSLKFRELTNILQLTNNDFIRTTDDRHKICAQEIWMRLEKNGWIYKGVYEGWYAIRDEAFYSEEEIVDGKAPSGAEVTWEKQESYFFKLSAFENKLLALYDAVPDFIEPKSKMNEVLSFVKGGLKDLSISRNTFSWGVKVPQNENHIMYVWLDALTNYLSALGFPDENAPLYQKFWLEASESPVHIVGKDILRFHGVYWPAFLMAAGLNLPHNIFAHGWWMNEGQKISKSIGNVIDPIKEIAWLESLGVSNDAALDYFKYFLMKETSFGSDGDYSRNNLITRINAELANNIGNLAQRSLSMLYKNNGGKIVDFKGYNDDLLKKGYDLGQKLREKMNKFAIDQAIFEILEFSSLCNQFINEKQPWNLKKEGKETEMLQVLSVITESLRIISIVLSPFAPNLAKKLQNILQIEEKSAQIENIDEKFAFKSGHLINEPVAIFPRLNNQEKI
jgi:methionyl-tRNA synthetase